MNTVERYYMPEHPALNEGNLPRYESRVQAVEGEWARVSIRPIGVESNAGPDIIYLQETTDLVITPTADAVSNAADMEHSDVIGWTVVAGPQARFTDAELDEIGVPQAIRP
ncbi:MAG: hypothetical protein R2856_23535 [Caldilineaceae bacterium]